MPHATLKRVVDSGLLYDLMMDLEADPFLLEENDPPGVARDEKEATLEWIFATHAYGGPVDWGWQSEPGVLRRIAPEELLQADYHRVWDCDATVLLLGAFDSVVARIRELGTSGGQLQGLTALSPAAKLAFGSSAHSGDFVWRAEPSTNSRRTSSSA
ncbi:MAG: hypothetical protein HOW73_22440 [Polyangiaceae bacterium]|nr:hypothetical protein [Polyangiaceae bacterium]